MERLEEWPAYFTATNLEWLPVLQDDQAKQIIIESLRFLIENTRARIYAYVVMSNHIHLIWQPICPQTHKSLQLSFMKFTAQQMKFYLEVHDQQLLEKCRVNAKDRIYQIWERNPHVFELFTPAVTYQKLHYIHENPVRAGLVKSAADYEFSSAGFYENNIDNFKLMLHTL